MSNLYIVAGLPGSGKSTWAHNMFPLVEHVSSDSIRLEYYSSLIEANRDKDANGRVFEEFHKRVDDKLGFYENVVADATCLTKPSRENLLKIAKKHGASAHLVLFVNTGQAIVRNKQRKLDLIVPEDAMAKMGARLTETQESLKKGEKKDYDSVTFIAAVA